MDEILGSWKEIAAFFGKGIRTVQRWEENFGLPVHRIARDGVTRQILFARASELEAWLMRHAIHDGTGSNGSDGEAWKSRAARAGRDGTGPAELLALIDSCDEIPPAVRRKIRNLLGGNSGPHLLEDQAEDQNANRKRA